MILSAACFQLVPLRREVYGLEAELTSPTPPAAADPVVAAHLAARARRDEARALAQGDPVLAHDLRIGRPDLPRQYDDGGLVDLNSAPAHAIATACSIEPSLAERIVTTRQELGSFSSLDEVFVYAQVEEGAAARIRDHVLLLPR
ncbi:helix-hairpin-helix domain-containing protein [Streptomyces puniciscabiei]|uniref:helix-hairpin-helix domain-containing protein n=1 Tax=Streptomyces puniciscabiei TaxID=164348 RepID=UPI0033290632